MTVICLDDRRPKPEPPAPHGSVADWQLIDALCTELLLDESVQGQIRATLAGILLETLAGNVEAVNAWRSIANEIHRPLRSARCGEAIYEPMLDKLRAVDQIAKEFWHADGRECPRYRPTEGS